MRIRMLLATIASGLGLAPVPPDLTADVEVQRLDANGNPMPDDQPGQQSPPPAPELPIGLSMQGDGTGAVLTLRVKINEPLSRTEIKDPQGNVVGEIRHYMVPDQQGNPVPCNATFNSAGGFGTIAVAEPDAP